MTTCFFSSRYIFVVRVEVEMEAEMECNARMNAMEKEIWLTREDPNTENLMCQSRQTEQGDKVSRVDLKFGQGLLFSKWGGV